MGIKIREIVKTEITISMPFSSGIAERLKPDIETIVKNLSADQINKLAKISKNAGLKNMALSALNNFVS